MNKIIYNGFYGFKNSGDDIFLETTSWATNKFMLNYEPTYIGNNLPDLITQNKVYKTPFFKGHDRLIVTNELRNAKYFVSAGGSTFSGHKKSSNKEIAEYVKKFYNKKLKTGAIGVSIGPFKTKKNESDVIEYLKKMDFLSVRDKRSYEFVKQLDLPYEPVEAFDLAALLPEVYKNIPFNKEHNFENKKIIGISICPVESITNKNFIEKEEQRNKKIEELIKKLNSLHDNLIFRFFIINGHKNIGDENLTKKMIENLGIHNYEIVPYQNKVYDIWASIKNCDFMIATRLHAAIMAAYADVPFILNEYHQKCTDFIIDIGQEKKWIVEDAYYNDSLVNNILDILSKKESFILKNIEQTRILSLKNYEFTKLI